MNIFINILVAIICLILGYIFGSIPTAVWIGKLFFHRDPRLEGSKNAGGTNAGRLFGKKVGVLVIAIDMIKILIPVWLSFVILTYVKFGDIYLLPRPREFSNQGFNFDYIIPWPVYWLTVVGCALGHCFPVFASFKGGKAVSVFIGTVGGTNWMIGFAPALVFYLGILKITKKVSLTSIICAGILALLSWSWSILVMTNIIPHDYMLLGMYGSTLCPGFVMSTCVTIEGLLLVLRHKENIIRLKNGTERTINWM